ncbi:MAG: transposase [Gammaproteobacteria bacterium]|nr:transposase [Gammaproteobacteria bacterium]
MENVWFQARITLNYLKEEHPDWTYQQFAEITGMSYGWVRKWYNRLEEKGDDPERFKSESRAPKNTQAKVDPEVVEKILEIRDCPPNGLNRTPGPLTIIYYLKEDEELKKGNYYIPSSTSTVWEILNENGRIDRPEKRETTPLTRAAPMEEWQIDFKDVGTVSDDQSEKQVHMVETLNIVDCGTSILLDNQARTDFNAETVIESLVHTFQMNGVPHQITFDRDPRFVGSWRGGDFPSPLVRFLTCIGVNVDICPPRRPDLNGFVERYHRTYKEEGIEVYRPADLEQVLDMNRDFRHHYNYQRPNQAITCGNQPPRLAFPELPTLPELPALVDPDSWVDTFDGKVFKRRVNASGSVQVDKEYYYIGQNWKDHYVLMQIDAANREFQVLFKGEVIKRVPIKGLHGDPMPFEEYVKIIKAKAVSQWRLYLSKSRRYVQIVA